MTERHVRVSPQVHARALDLKNALERLDLAEGRTKDHPSVGEVVTALAQIAGLVPPPVEPRDVTIRDNVIRLLRAEPSSHQPSLPQARPREAA